MRILSVCDHFAASYGFNQETLVGQLAIRVNSLMPHIMEYHVEAGPDHLSGLRPHPTDVSQQMVAVSGGWARLAHTMLKVSILICPQKDLHNHCCISNKIFIYETF